MTDQPGYIYLMRLDENLNPDMCAYKIGKSKSAQIRHKQLGILMPYPLTVVCTIAVEDMVWAESYLHSIFIQFRLNGEWFHLSSKDVTWICALTTADLVPPAGWGF